MHYVRLGPEIISWVARIHKPIFRVHSGDRKIADNNSFEQWESEGSLDAAQRANGRWKSALAGYFAPSIDIAIDEALLDYIKVRKDSFS